MTQPDIYIPTIEEIVERAGGARSIAEQCGITAIGIYGWKQVPLRHIQTLAAMTGFTIHQLRPDVYAPDDKGVPPFETSEDEP